MTPSNVQNLSVYLKFTDIIGISTYKLVFCLGNAGARPRKNLPNNSNFITIPIQLILKLITYDKNSSFGRHTT